VSDGQNQGGNNMLYELEVLEIRRIADLALDARKVRDRLLEKVPASDLGEPVPARGEHNPGGSVALTEILAAQPEMLALQQAIVALPQDIRQKLWTVSRLGRGDVTRRDWEKASASAALMSDDDMTADLVAEPDLHDHLHKGLYLMDATDLPGGR
jgi:hypothetical protein